MANILFIGDLHLKISRMAECKQVLAWIEESIQQYKPDFVVNLGDTFNDHGVLRSELLTLFRNHIRNITVPYIYVLGNHDQYKADDNKYHALQNFDKESNLTIVAEPTSVFGITFVPYLKDNSTFPQNTESICVAHQTFLGADYGFMKPDDGVDPNTVSANTIISGHIHMRQHFGKVIYPGTPIAHSAHDVNQEKGLLLFDTESMECKYLPSCLPLWKSLDLVLSNTKDPISYIVERIDKNNKWILKIVGLKAEVSSLLNAPEYIQLTKAHKISVRIEYKDTEKKQYSIKAMSIEDSIKEYINNIYQGTIDKQQLLDAALDFISQEKQ